MVRRGREVVGNEDGAEQVNVLEQVLVLALEVVVLLSQASGVRVLQLDVIHSFLQHRTLCEALPAGSQEHERFQSSDGIVDHRLAFSFARIMPLLEGLFVSALAA